MTSDRELDAREWLAAEKLTPGMILFGTIRADGMRWVRAWRQADRGMPVGVAGCDYAVGEIVVPIQRMQMQVEGKHPGL